MSQCCDRKQYIIIHEQPYSTSISVPDRTEGDEDTPTCNAIVRNNTLYGDVRGRVSEMGSGTSRSVINLIYITAKNCTNAFDGDGAQSNNFCTTQDPGFIDLNTENDPRLYNFALASNAQELIDKGSASFGASEDYNEKNRDSSPDIGALEYP